MRLAGMIGFSAGRFLEYTQAGIDTTDNREIDGPEFGGFMGTHGSVDQVWYRTLDDAAEDARCHCLFLRSMDETLDG